MKKSASKRTIEITLDGEHLNPTQLYFFSQAALSNRPIKISIAPVARKRIEKAAKWVEKIAAGDDAVYGVNTGFGKFAEVSIGHEKLRLLQRNLILSHACGVGPLLERDIVLCMWIIRLNTIARGNSGARVGTADFIVSLLEKGILADIPSRGSVGASGDLSPSAHATLTLIGEGRSSHFENGKVKHAKSRDILSKYKLKAIDLAPKEGLSLINGTQTTTALALKAAIEGLYLVRVSNLALAMTLEGLRASREFIDMRILRARNQPGCEWVGRDLQNWLGKETSISKSHEDCGRVQDPYSLRCAPQVHGAIYDEVHRALEVIGREVNSSTDNPLLFPEDFASLSGGNFHALYTARVSDSLATALTTLSSISERRTALAMSPESSQLPAFLVRDGGLNSGFMMAHVTAAALVSESKSLSFPASVDSIPTSDDREDHVSMGPGAGFKAVQIVDNTRRVLAIEILAAAQAIDLLRPLKTSPALEAVHAKIRAEVKMLSGDRILSDDIQTVERMLKERVLFE